MSRFRRSWAPSVCCCLSTVWSAGERCRVTFGHRNVRLSPCLPLARFLSKSQVCSRAHGIAHRIAHGIARRPTIDLTPLFGECCSRVHRLLALAWHVLAHSRSLTHSRPHTPSSAGFFILQFLGTVRITFPWAPALGSSPRCSLAASTPSALAGGALDVTDDESKFWP